MVPRAKVLVNLVIEKLKHHMKAYPDDASAMKMFFAESKPLVSRSFFPKELHRLGYLSQDQDHDKFEEPPGREARKLELTFRVKTSEGLIKPFTVGGEFGRLYPKSPDVESQFRAMGYHRIDTLSGHLVFRPSITKRNIIQNLDKVYMELLNWASHELEHQQQHYRGEITSDHRDSYQSASGRDLMKYLMQDIEIAAFARGFYTQSVKLRIPFEKIIEDQKKTFFDFAKKRKNSSWLAWFILKKTTKEDMDKWGQAILDYARIHLPCAQLKDGTPINPDLCKR